MSVDSLTVQLAEAEAKVASLKEAIKAENDKVAFFRCGWFYKDAAHSRNLKWIHASKLEAVLNEAEKLNRRRWIYGIGPYGKVGGNNVHEWIASFAKQNPNVEITCRVLFDLSPYMNGGWQRFQEAFRGLAMGTFFESIGDGVYRTVK